VTSLPLRRNNRGRPAQNGKKEVMMTFSFCVYVEVAVLIKVPTQGPLFFHKEKNRGI